jgi:O-antigen/teichoic acid export membrane protein
VAFSIVVRKSGFRRINWSRTFSFMIIRQSFPFAVLILLMTFYNRVDSVMLERLLSGQEGDVQAGIYASAYRLLDAANMIAYLFAVLLLPMFSRMIKNKQNTDNLVKLSFTLLFTISVPVAASSYFFADEIMAMLYLEHAAESALVFRVLMPGFIAISTTYVFGTLLTANNNLRELNLVAAGGMALNILLNLILIPDFKAEGSAYASLTTQLLTAALQVYIAVRHFRVRVNPRFVLTLFLFFCGSVLLHYLISNSGTSWMLELLSSFIVSLVLAATLRLLPLRQMLKILRTGTQ